MKDHDLGEPLAVGRTAEIYRWAPGRVVKLYFDWFQPEDADLERRLARAVYAAGLPVPATGEIVHIAGRVGLIYQRCEGASMDLDLAQHPLRLFAHARQLAELHAELHARPMRADLPPLRRRLAHKIRHANPLPGDLRAAALAALEALPDGDRLCHGDFHPGNILLSRPDPVIIDWIDAALGRPLADVARTSILALGSAATQEKRYASLGVRLLHAVYLRHYFKIRPGGRDEYRRWLPIVAAGRLSEGIIELEPWLVGQASRLR